MIKKYYIGIIICVLLVIFYFLIFDYIKIPLQNTNINHPVITIQHGQYFDSSKTIIIVEDEKGFSLGDFRWESTGYQYGGIGSINSNYMISMHPPKFITASRLKKVLNSDFDSVTRLACSEIKYEQMDYFLRVNDGDILCISTDKNKDGIFGDGYLKLKIISHTDAKEGNYADSVTFIYKVL